MKNISIFFGFRTPHCDDTLQMLDDMRKVERLPRDSFENSFMFAVTVQRDRLLGQLRRSSR